MSKSNSVRLIGNVGNDPKLVSQNEAGSILTMSFATHENFKKQDGTKEKKTEWHNIVAFGKVAELMLKYLKKGDKAMLEGRLQTRQYNDKTGNQRYVTEIVIEEVLFLSNVNQANS
jgi:single-strand DNA-binding protein